MSMAKIDIEQIKADREATISAAQNGFVIRNIETRRDVRKHDVEAALIEAVDLLDSMAYDDYVPNSQVRKFLERFE